MSLLSLISVGSSLGKMIRLNFLTGRSEDKVLKPCDEGV